MQYHNHFDTIADMRHRIADALCENHEIIAGYLVVGVRIDGTMVVGHNSCCLAHMIGIVLSELKAHPEMNVQNPGLPEAHDS